MKVFFPKKKNLRVFFQKKPPLVTFKVVYCEIIVCVAAVLVFFFAKSGEREKCEGLRGFAMLVADNKKNTSSTKASVGNISNFECCDNDYPQR